MGYPTRHVVAITTATGGGGTGYTSVVHGRIASIDYALGATGSTFPSGTDVTVSLEDTGHSLWAQSNIGTSALTKRPMMPAHSAAGADLSTGSAAFVPAFASTERVKVVVAQGGNTKSGSFAVVVV